MATAVTTVRSTGLHQYYNRHYNSPRSKGLILTHSYVEVDPKFLTSQLEITVVI